MDYNNEDIERLNSIDIILSEKQFDMDALTAKTQIHLKYGKYDEALGSIDNVLKVFPRSYSALFHKYVVYIKTGDLEKAGYQLDNLIDSDEKNIDSIVNLNWVYDQILSEDEKNRFLIDYKSLLSRKKREKYLLEHSVEEPVHPLDKSKVYAPVNKNKQTDSGKVNTPSKNKKENGPDKSDILSDLTLEAMAYIKKQDYESALLTINNTLSLFPKSYSALFHKYVVYIKTNDLENAKKTLEDIIELDEKNIDSITKLNHIYETVLSEDEKNKFNLDYNKLLSEKKRERRNSDVPVVEFIDPLDKSRHYSNPKSKKKKLKSKIIPRSKVKPKKLQSDNKKNYSKVFYASILGILLITGFMYQDQLEEYFGDLLDGSEHISYTVEVPDVLDVNSDPYDELRDYNGDYVVDMYDNSLYYLQPYYLDQINDNFANSLKGDSLSESAYNILLWEESNIDYDYAKYNQVNSNYDVELRSPYETYRDKKGICSEYALLTSAILLKQGYTPYIFDMDDKNGNGHAFCAVKIGNEFYAIDQITPVRDVVDNIQWFKINYSMDLGDIRYYKFEKNKNTTEITENVIYCPEGTTIQKMPQLTTLDMDGNVVYDEETTKYLAKLERFIVNNLLDEFPNLHEDYRLEDTLESNTLPYTYQDGVTWKVQVTSYPEFLNYVYREVMADEDIYEDLQDYESIYVHADMENGDTYATVILAK
ncbi:transglutaminase-like domain-containing protein [Methanococcus maripaludis]|uniref:Tfp pilus assembly protein PilF n=1 Tax=Methanococcus maripaludis TaxID=39152 RepID=A0A7J9PMM9_METMI|nr:transglutaminase-like domain-containing protein [Methanococcus maripaludis]MBA2863980.1 Tfp pilus assembly protein PilF [Methanococcus maripaludis]